MVPGEASGGGKGLCVRNKGWMWDWSVEFALSRDEKEGLPSCEGRAAGVSKLAASGVSGRSASSSSEGWAGKGPSSGFAGEAGRLAGMVSSRVLGGGMLMCPITSTDDSLSTSQ